MGTIAWWLLGMVLGIRAVLCLEQCNNASCPEIQANLTCSNCIGARVPIQATINEAFLYIDPILYTSHPPPSNDPRPGGNLCATKDMICRSSRWPPPGRFCCAACDGGEVKCRMYSSSSNQTTDQKRVQVIFLVDANAAIGTVTAPPPSPSPPPPPEPCSSAGCNATLGSCPRNACSPGCRCKKSSKTTLIIGAASGAGLALVFLVLCGLWCIISKRRTSSKRRCSSDRAQILTDTVCIYTPTVFTFKELKTATRSFAESRLLGGGGFSTVYQGKLPDGRVVAVKRLNQGNKQGIQQFQNEVNILSQVRHRNLVQLLGYCLEGRDLLLVYEYVLHGTLADHLHGDRGNGLSLETRLSIALETAQALAYLHFSVKPPIYHRDVKSSNILLDKDFHAKVADFGLSKLTHLDCTHVSTAPQGTPGYLDPDYHESYQLTDKSDVYSFGVVLLELISRKKAVDMNRDRKEINLASMALARIHSGALHELFDPDLSVKYWKLLTRLVEIAFRCLAPEKDDRPNMVEVVRELEQLSSMVMNSSSSKKSSRFKLDSSSCELKKQRSIAMTGSNLEQESPTSVQVKWPSTHTSPSHSRSEIYK